jgi:hypothetical protein
VFQGTQFLYGSSVPCGIGKIVVPAGATKLTATAIGAGGNSGTVAYKNGGGGGAYAKTSCLSVTAGNIVYWKAFCSDSWVNISSNTAPTSTAQGVLAKAGLRGCTANTGGGAGGSAASSIGTTVFSGGNGGATAYINGSSGGGGGAAGPNGAGGNGGTGFGASCIFGHGGGGGVGGLCTTAGSAGTATNGGAGGQGPLGISGGVGATSSSYASTAAAGSGGGGGGGWSNGAYACGKQGSKFYILSSSAYGPAGGKGGGGYFSVPTCLFGSGGAAAALNKSGGFGLVALTWS